MSRILSFIRVRRFSRACLFLTAAFAGVSLGRLGRNHFGHSAPARSPVNSGGFWQAGHGEATPPGSNRDHPGLAGMATVSARTVARLARNRGADYWLYLLAAAEEAPPELLARLLDSLRGGPSAAALLGRRWAQRDPAGMLNFLQSRPFSPQGDPYTPSASGSQQDRSLRQLQQILAQEWLRRDPEALIAALSGKESKSSASDLKAARLETVRLLAGTDPGRTIGLMLTWALPLDTADGPAFVSWVGAHPRQAAEQLFPGGNDRGIGWDYERCQLLKETIKTLAATDPKWALQIQQTRSGPAASLFWAFSTGVLTTWAQRDLPAAAAFLADKQNGLSRGRKDDLSQALLDLWGAKDPASALAWANAQLTGPAKNRALKSMLHSLAALDSAQALDFLDRLPPGRARDGIFGEVVETILDKNDQSQAAATLRWMTSLSDPIQRDTALKAGAGKLMEAAPDEFLAWLETPEGRTQAPYGALQQTARILSKDPAKALEWAAGLRPEAAPPIRRELIERWFWNDFDAPTAWIRNQPAGPARADSIVSATTYLAQENSTGKLQEWLNSLPASDRPAILQGINEARELDTNQKAELTAKYGGGAP